MLKKYQLLIVKRYLKAFFTIFVALTVFFTGVDLVGNMDKLPDSANLKILFVINRFMFFSTMTFVLSLMFALISSTISLIKENELVVIYSFGGSKIDVLKPFLAVMMIFILFFWYLNTTSTYVNSVQIADNIKEYGRASSNESNLFLKSKDNYIFISKLNKYKKEGQGIKIFDTEGIELKSIIEAKSGEFKDNFWLLKDVKVIKKPNLSDTIDGKKLEITHHDSMRVLDGFKPTIIESLYNGAKGLTITDSVDAIFLLKDKGVSINSIKANLYGALFFPLVSIFIAVILFFKLPIQKRGENLAVVSASMYFISLVIWGVFYMMIKVSKNGAIAPELGIIAPVVLLGLFSFIYSKKKISTF